MSSEINSPAIRIQNLTKHYPVPLRRKNLVAVRDLSLDVQQGEVYGLLGPNGSGKSTTLKAVLGLVTPTSGSTEIFGRDSKDVASREQVGFLPENPYFYKYLTGLETLVFFGRVCGMTGSSLRQRARELLDLVGLNNASDRRLGGYSKGMLQRIGLAQALIQSPRLVVLDEPTAGVDPAGSRQIRDLILKLRDSGITVLLCSHLLGQVQEICDRVGILSRGVLVREGPLKELISIETQTEVIVEGGGDALIDAMAALAESHGAQIVARRKPQTSLEDYYLNVTGGSTDVKEG
jgi:ABC-2 type transport system ATP-binding protein